MRRFGWLLIMMCLLAGMSQGLGESAPVSTPAPEAAETQGITLPEVESGESVPMDDEDEGPDISPEDLPDEEDLMEEVLETRDLQYGDEGDDVLELQNRLKDLKYYTGNLSGRYREGTREAVKSFQGDYGLEETGIADRETQNLIFTAQYRPLRYGASGDEVKRLQSRLTELGYYKGKISGNFLGGTQKSLRTFQETNGLTATGAADVATQELLYSAKAIGKAGAAAASTGAELTGYLVDDAEGAAADSATVGYVAYTKTLKSGSSGALVKELQSRMQALGYYDGPVSGNFARQTLRAVKTIQTQNGLEATGKVDETTWNVIFNDSGIVMPGATPRPTPEPTPVPYAITVDVTNQVTTVYGLDENNEYTIPVRRMLCSTGTKASPSEVGDWVLNGRHARWCVFPKWGNSYARYWTRINSDIAFHSVIYTAVSNDAMKTSSYKMLGNRASHGCIRLTVEDAKWVYENIGAGTVVSIREDLPSDPELRDALKLPALKKGTSIPVETPVPTPEPDYDPAAVPETGRKLKKGSEGPDVFWVQRRLQELGFYTGYAGGKMLNGTVSAVKSFQRANGVYASGEVDAKTLALLAAPAETPTPAPETVLPTETPTP
ncbi:MAG: peptidoglycan-binding protein [Clostridia bacterium]|nr:peptidoglycan-binding protein [Clostridia bacterium]